MRCLKVPVRSLLKCCFRAPKRLRQAPVGSRLGATTGIAEKRYISYKLSRNSDNGDMASWTY